MIEVSHLCKSYQGVVALDDVSFTVERGTVCGLLGPNGAGKSTTMNIMAGCLAASSGEVRYDGLEIYANMREVKRAVGYLPEIPPVYPEMTVYEYLEFVAEAKGVDRRDVRREAERLARACGLTDVYQRLIKNLSKGYRQRVGLAQALVGDPRYLILDEPTVGLDPVQIIEVRDLIHRLGGTRTVLVSSHILSEIRTLCDRIVMIAHGRVVADDTPDNLEKRFSGKRCVTVLAQTSPRELADALADLTGANGRLPGLELDVVEAEEPGMARAQVRAAADDDLRPLVARALLDAGIAALEMTAERASLEDVFVELLAKEDARARDL